MPSLLYEQPPYGGLLRTAAHIRAVHGCPFLTAAGGLLRSPVNVAAHLLKNVAAHSNSIHAPAFCGGMDKYSPALSDCINSHLREFAPGRAKSPEHKPKVCAEGVFRSQTPRA